MTRTIALNIAEMVITDEPVVVSTVLGSCISVCLYSAQKQAGGIIHFALPEAPADCAADDYLRYGDRAIPILVENMAEFCRQAPRDFSAKIVGGANNLGKTNIHSKVGSANVEAARRILQEYGIDVVGEDVGGAVGRKVHFHVQTGRLQVAPLAQVDPVLLQLSIPTFPLSPESTGNPAKKKKSA